MTGTVSPLEAAASAMPDDEFCCGKRGGGVGISRCTVIDIFRAIGDDIAQDIAHHSRAMTIDYIVAVSDGEFGVGKSGERAVPNCCTVKDILRAILNEVGRGIAYYSRAVIIVCVVGVSDDEFGIGKGDGRVVSSLCLVIDTLIAISNDVTGDIAHYSRAVPRVSIILVSNHEFGLRKSGGRDVSSRCTVVDVLRA
jgi:hypothetical protein